MPVSWFFPRIFGGSMVQDPFPPGAMPIDVSHLSLFDTMYVHPLVRDSMLIWNHYDMVALKSAAVATGSGYGFAQYVGGKPDEINHTSKALFNKAWKRVYKYIVPPYRNENPGWGEWLRRLIFDSPVEDAGRYIDVAPFPTHIDGDGIAHFADNGREEYQRIKNQVIKPDVVIFATGYLQSFPFLESKANTNRRPYPKANDANVRDVWMRDDPTVGFIGFVRPSFGAIPPLSEMQAMLFIMNLLGRINKPLLPDDEWHYRLIKSANARINYGIEHDSYVYQLAKDMDMAPSFTEVLRLGFSASSTGSWWRLPFIWAAGPNFVTKFRMRGPWAWDGAVGVMTDDLWEIIRRRKGMYGNFPMAILPMFYLGLLHLFCLLYATLFDILAKLGLASPVEIVNQPKMMIEAMTSKDMYEEKKRKSGEARLD
jgi:dimethylaniline monooxygenase (N-oxide forming)